MSVWGWPQWVVLILLVMSIVQNVIIGVMDSQKTHEQLLLDAAARKDEWQLRIFIVTVIKLFEMFLLAEGGFWG